METSITYLKEQFQLKDPDIRSYSPLCLWEVVNGMSLPYPKHIWSSTDPVTGCWDCYLSIALPCRDLVTDGCLQWQELWNWSCVQQQLFCW